MSTFVEMIEFSDAQAKEYVEAANEGVVEESVEGAMVYAMLALESRIEWLGFLLAPMFAGQPVARISPLLGDQTTDMP